MTDTINGRSLRLIDKRDAAAQVSPDWVRISTASAIALRFRSGRFNRDFDFGGINLSWPSARRCNSVPTRPSPPSPCRRAPRPQHLVAWCADRTIRTLHEFAAQRPA